MCIQYFCSYLYITHLTAVGKKATEEDLKEVISLALRDAKDKQKLAVSIYYIIRLRCFICSQHF